MSTLTHDPVKGTVTFDGERPWRATTVAAARVKGAEVHWTKRLHQTYVVVVGPQPIGHIRCYPQHKRYTVTLTGFEFWDWNAILLQQHFKTAKGFDSLRDARAFVRTVLTQAGAARVART